MTVDAQPRPPHPVAGAAGRSGAPSWWQPSSPASAGGWPGGAGAGSAPTAAVTVVVRPGDTVWSIASRHAGGEDIRTEVAQILSRNGLPRRSIQPGETLVVPAG